MNIEIVYQDKNILALNKPSGLMVHSDGRSKEKTLTDWLLENYPELKDVGEPIILSNGEKIIRPGIVHRLDKATSGILVVAKNQKTFEYLKKLFQSREIKKEYRAIVWGRVKDDEGVIDKPIGKSRSDFRMYSAEYGARGEMREAVTEYSVLERGEKFSFVALYPKTGRTHQIRVHMKSVGHPVLCDSLYAKGRSCELGLKRLALHASILEFSTPEGVKLRLEAPLASDIEEALKSL